LGRSGFIELATDVSTPFHKYNHVCGEGFLAGASQTGAKPLSTGLSGFHPTSNSEDRVGLHSNPEQNFTCL
jgi:hypothetical protein